MSLVLLIALILVPCSAPCADLFLPLDPFAAGVQPISLAAGDLDGDGVADLAVATVGQYSAEQGGFVAVP
jgi:hypothetical protein